jgi:hypothetical protein
VIPLRNSAYDEAGQRFMADACRAGRDALDWQTVTDVGATTTRRVDMRRREAAHGPE